MRNRCGFILVGLLTIGLVHQHSFSSGQEALKIPELSQSPKIDGILDNPLWEQEALKIEDFVQFTPKEKGTPSEKTIAYVGYDKKNLYLAFRCFEKDPKKIRATITNRIPAWVILSPSFSRNGFSTQKLKGICKTCEAINVTAPIPNKRQGALSL